MIGESEVLLFMKGNRDAPQCGFSATVVQILDRLVPAYRTFDVLADPAVREGIKDYSSWPTVPQLYVRGEFLGGCDIIQELFGTGELHTQLGVETAPATPPAIEITVAAAEALRQATADAPPEQALHLAIDARFQSRLYLGPEEPGSIAIESGGLTLRMDPLSAGRARDGRIDVVQSGGGQAFQVALPNAPNAVKTLTVKELRTLLDSGEAFELFDVRTPEEREIAQIEGSTRIDEEQTRRIEGLPRDALLVFHCHHGGRSQAAAEHFAAMGFTRAHNVHGGIEAWSLEIDPSVPRY
jgi:monothiol glutaredoxin